MSITVNGDAPANLRNVVAILRLVVDAQGHLKQGELVDAETRSLGRFADWRGLICALRAWLESRP